MIIKNCKIRGKEGLYDVTVEDGRFRAITSVPAMRTGGADMEGVVDAKGNMIMPPFVESHIHLDFALTAGIPHYNMSGTVLEGIATWAEYKNTQPMEIASVKERATEALRMMAQFGVQFVRTQMDVTEESFRGVNALLELKEDMKGIMGIQTVAFPQDGILSKRNGKELMKRAMDLGADCVGGLPHGEYTREYGIESIKYSFELAERYDAYVDIHCDETDDDQSRFIETVAAMAWEREMGARTVAAHTCAMGSYNNAYCAKLFNLLKVSGINFNSSPLGSIHMLGRTDTYPKRRGLTRVKEILAEGMNLAFSRDNFYDSFYPLGAGNPLRILEMGLHVAQMTGYEDLSRCLDLVSANGARIMCLADEEYGIEVGKYANFILLDGENDYDVLRFFKPVVLSVHHGKVIAEKKPAVPTVHF